MNGFDDVNANGSCVLHDLCRINCVYLLHHIQFKIEIDASYLPKFEWVCVFYTREKTTISSADFGNSFSFSLFAYLVLWVCVCLLSLGRLVARCVCYAMFNFELLQHKQLARFYLLMLFTNFMILFTASCSRVCFYLFSIWWIFFIFFLVRFFFLSLHFDLA